MFSEEFHAFRRTLWQKRLGTASSSAWTSSTAGVDVDAELKDLEEMERLLKLGRQRLSVMDKLNAPKVKKMQERLQYLQTFIIVHHAKHPNLDSGALWAAAVSEAMKFPLSRKQAKRYANLLTIPK